MSNITKPEMDGDRGSMVVDWYVCLNEFVHFFFWQ